MVKFVKNRIEDILKLGLLKDKTVLELGCVGMGKDDEIGGVNWIHGKAQKVSKKIVGLDYSKKGVAKLRKMGYDVRYQNVEKKFDLKEKFDIVLAEEILEHLNNVGQCMDNIKRHLKKGGLLIITTPHAQSISFFLQRLIKNKITGVSITDHTHWHDANTLKTLLNRYGFKIKKLWYVHPRPVVNKIKGYFVQSFFSLFPERMGRNIMCIAEKVN